MKRPTASSDVDIRGRVRRQPQQEPAPLIEALMVDGPVAGTKMLVPRGADYVKVGLWTYSYAGKENRVPLYCKQRTSRAERRLVKLIVGKRGSDPRVMLKARRPNPVKRTSPPAQGRGARRRAEARANAVS